MPEVEVARMGTKLEFEEEGDNRRETTLDLGALVAAEAPDLLRSRAVSTKEIMRTDGLVANFFTLPGYEVTTYRISAAIQLLLFTLSFAFDIYIYLTPSEATVWSASFLIAFVSNCVFLVDILLRISLGSSPFAWLVLVSFGACFSQPQFLPACLVRYQAAWFGGFCASTLILRFFKEGGAILGLSAFLWFSVALFACGGVCPINILYGVLLKGEKCHLGEKTRNFFINQSQPILHFTPCGLNVHVETQEPNDAPRPW